MDLPYLKDVRPEDIQDVSEQYVTLFAEERNAADIEDFRRLPGEEIEAILQDTPEHLMDTIADVLRVFLLKMNVPVPETEKLTDKVREKKMAELFADMEKIDIQAERRNTADANRRADKAEERADITEENGIKSLIEVCQELGASKDSAIRKLMEKNGLSMEAALEKTALYWKD